MAALPLITLALAVIPPVALAAMPPSLDGTAWVLDSNDAVSLQFEQDRVSGSDGSVRATLVPQSKSLAGSWQVSAYNNGRQAVVSPLLGTVLDLSFLGDGRIGGSSGCNRYSAKIQVEGSQVAISTPLSTRRLCSTPAGVMEQERQFLAALAAVATLRHEGQRLELRRADGALALILQRLPTAATP